MINICYLLCGLVFLVLGVESNEISKNVNTVEPGSLYKGDYDTSKFRLGISELDYTTSSGKRNLASPADILSFLKNSPSQLCDAVKDVKSLSLKNSTAYVVSALKKAGSIPDFDKDYSLESANFFWEIYLGYRNFIDLSDPLKREGYLNKELLPNGSILNVEKGCNKNGATAIYCDGKFFTTKFVDVDNLFSKINDDEIQQCKVGNGFRVIVEAGRLKPQI